jgi:fructose-bisphosphate aldolase class II
MPAINRSPANLLRLKASLAVAERHGYALGSFAPRYTPMIAPVLRAAQRTASPLIVQISQRELVRYQLDAKTFADAFFRAMADERVEVPVVLHLDHSFELPVLASAIDAGFTSVMMDQSTQPLQENIAVTREASRFAHERGVSIEAELGRIGTTDHVETEHDDEYFTDPEEAGEFVAETGVDALAVSVGTAHGPYTTRQPRIDLPRLAAIRARTGVHLVLHGGSGVPPQMIQQAVRMSGGGVSKVNIATDLEEAVLRTLGRSTRMTNEECLNLPADRLEAAQAAVESTVVDKLRNFLGSAGRAADFRDLMH